MAVDYSDMLVPGHYTIWLTESRPPALACFQAWQKAHADRVKVVASYEVVGDESWEAKLLGIARPSSTSIGFVVTELVDRWDLKDPKCKGAGVPTIATPDETNAPGVATGAVEEGSSDPADHESVIHDVFGGGSSDSGSSFFHIPGYVWGIIAVGAGFGIYKGIKDF